MKLRELVNATKSLLPTLKTIPTRFRAYRLENAGSSFSYFDGADFTLIEARLNDANIESTLEEMQICKKTRVDILHVTSWDEDHCSLQDLKLILSKLSPIKIEYPGYSPSTQSGKDCLAEILQFSSRKSTDCKAYGTTPEFIKSLGTASTYGYKNVLYHPKKIVDKSNDNSTVKLFRTGCFNVLSLGDVESVDIAALIKTSKIAREEIDVLILPHHGANNGFLTSDLLDELKPKLAVCGSNHGNQYDHPAKEIRSLLGRKNIELATTARGDVIVWSDNGTSSVKWIDTKADTSEFHKAGEFEPKKFDKLSKNSDSIRASLQRHSYRSIK